MELFYKGYRTDVKFDEEEKYFYGKLEGITPSIKKAKTKRQKRIS